MEQKENWNNYDWELPRIDKKHKSADQRTLVTLKQNNYTENCIKEYIVKHIKTKEYHKSIPLCPLSPHPKT